MQKTLFTIYMACAIIITGCGGSDKKEEEKTTTEVKEKPAAKEELPIEAAETRRPPIINITDTVSAKQILLCMKDSAATVERLQLKIAEILNMKLDAVIKKGKVKVTGRPTAWYRSTKAPYFFEVGLPVDKKPAKMPSNVFVRDIAADSVTVAHFYGNYDMLSQAYEALGDWMKSHKKKLDGKPYEVYVDDLKDKDGKMKDPYKVRTDVIFPWK